MRGLKESFLQDLEQGMLAPLLKAVKKDRDLNIEIRKDYLNVYYRGNSMPLVQPSPKGGYEAILHPKFMVSGMNSDRQTSMKDETAKEGTSKSVPYDVMNWGAQDKVEAFVRQIPFIKQNISLVKSHTNELEVEQLISRFNGRDGSANTDYYIFDRQGCTDDREGRFDLMGIYWPTGKNRQHQTVQLALLEVKHCLNPDLPKLGDQMFDYHKAIARSINTLADEAEQIIRQKIRLGLLRKELGTLKIVRDPSKVKYAGILVDANPRSAYLRRLSNNLKILSAHGPDEAQFVSQLVLFNIGFGLWDCRSYTILLNHPSGIEPCAKEGKDKAMANLIITNSNNQVITSVKEWEKLAPPQSAIQWQDGHSAKELAKAFFRTKNAMIPKEIETFFNGHPEFRGFKATRALAELETRLDNSRKGRHHDLVLFDDSSGEWLVAIEAKADESFGKNSIGQEYLKAKELNGSELPMRIEDLCKAIFSGRSHLDAAVAKLRYQLLYAAAGTLIEAKEKKKKKALLLIYEFETTVIRRSNIDRNHQDLDAFAKTLAGSGISAGHLLGPIKVPGGGKVPNDVELWIGLVSVNL